MFQSLSTISPTNTRLRCVLSFHDQCLKPHRPLYLVLRFQPLDPPFLLEPQSAWGSSLLFCRLQKPGCLDELQVMQIAGSRCPCSPVIGLPNRPLLVTVSAMCFANVSRSGHHISPLSSHMRCGICQPHRQGRHFQPIPQDHAEGGILLGLLKHQSASDLSFRLASRGWLVTQMMRRWSDSVAPITSSSNAMSVVGAKRSVTMWSSCFSPPFPQPTYEFSGPRRRCLPCRRNLRPAP